jgi:hypothetical protein
MSTKKDQVVIKLDPTANTLTFTYKPRTDRALFDICDLNGRILKTGEVDKKDTKVKVAELHEDQYILLVLDGDEAASKRFEIKRAS